MENQLASEADLIFVLLALQLGFIRSEELIEAGAICVTDPQKSIREELLAREMIEENHAQMLQQLVREHMEKRSHFHKEESPHKEEIATEGFNLEIKAFKDNTQQNFQESSHEILEKEPSSQDISKPQEHHASEGFELELLPPGSESQKPKKKRSNTLGFFAPVKKTQGSKTPQDKSENASSSFFAAFPGSETPSGGEESSTLVRSHNSSQAKTLPHKHSFNRTKRPTDLGERYLVRREIGRGGIARVWLAHDQNMNRDVAVKELLSASLKEKRGTHASHTASSSERRFLREARLTGKLEHPGIIPIYEIGERPDGSSYYTMKFVRGEPLSKIIKRLNESTSLSADKQRRERLKLISVLIDVCDAIAYANKQGVVHRDLKPHNIMVGEFGETLVLDWGMAKDLYDEDSIANEELEERIDMLGSISDSDAHQERGSSLTVGGEILGTPAYMSPEQADGNFDQIDQVSDVYGLGAILYEILTGYPPYYPIRSPYSLLEKLRSRVQPDNLADKHSELAPDLISICQKAMMMERKERYQNAEALGKDLQRWREGRPVSVHQYSTLQATKRFILRNKTVVGVGASACVLMVLTVILLLQYFEAQRQDDAEELVAGAEVLFSKDDLYKAQISVNKALALVPEYAEAQALQREIASAVGKLEDEKKIALENLRKSRDQAKHEAQNAFKAEQIARRERQEAVQARKEAELAKQKAEDAQAQQRVLAKEMEERAFELERAQLVRAERLFALGKNKTQKGEHEEGLRLMLESLALYVNPEAQLERAQAIAELSPPRLRLGSYGAPQEIEALASAASFVAFGDSTGKVFLYNFDEPDLSFPIIHESDSMVSALALSPQAKHLLVAYGDNSIRLFKVGDFNTLYSDFSFQNTSLWNEKLALAWNSQGSTFAYANKADQIQLVDINNFYERKSLLSIELTEAESIQGICFAGKNEQSLLVSTNKELKHYRIEGGLGRESEAEEGKTPGFRYAGILEKSDEGTEIIAFESHPAAPFFSLVYSNGKLQLYDKEHFALQQEVILPVDFPLTSYDLEGPAFSHSGDKLSLCIINQGAFLIDLESEEVHQHFIKETWNTPSICFTPDSQGLIFSSISSYDSFEPVLSIRAVDDFSLLTQSTLSSYASISKLALSPNDRWTSAGYSSGLLRLWETSSGEEQARLSMREEVSAMTFSEDEQYFAAGSINGEVKIWKCEDGELQTRFKINNTKIAQLVFAQESNLLFIASEDGVIQVWKVRENGTLLKKPVFLDMVWFQTGTLAAFSFSAHKNIVVASSSEGELLLWSLSERGELIADGTLERPLQNPDSNVMELESHQDRGLEKGLLSGSDMEHDQEVGHFSKVRFLCVPDESQNLIGDVFGALEDGRIVCWSLESRLILKDTIFEYSKYLPQVSKTEKPAPPKNNPSDSLKNSKSETSPNQSLRADFNAIEVFNRHLLVSYDLFKENSGVDSWQIPEALTQKLVFINIAKPATLQHHFEESKSEKSAQESFFQRFNSSLNSLSAFNGLLGVGARSFVIGRPYDAMNLYDLELEEQDILHMLEGQDKKTGYALIGEQAVPSTTFSHAFQGFDSWKNASDSILEQLEEKLPDGFKTRFLSYYLFDRAFYNYWHSDQNQENSNQVLQALEELCQHYPFFAHVHARAQGQKLLFDMHEKGFLETDIKDRLQRILERGFPPGSAEDLYAFASTKREDYRYSFDASDAQIAIQYFKEAIGLQPSMALAKRDLGLLYLELKDYDQSLHWLSEAQSAIPKDTLIRASLAQCYYQFGHTAEADALFVGIDIENNTWSLPSEVVSSYWAIQGRKMLEKKEFLQASEFLEKAIEHDEYVGFLNDEIYALLAQAYAQAGTPLKGIKNLSKVIEKLEGRNLPQETQSPELQEELAEWYLLRAEIRFEVGHYAATLRDCELLLQGDSPQKPKAQAFSQKAKKLLEEKVDSSALPLESDLDYAGDFPLTFLPLFVQELYQEQAEDSNASGGYYYGEEGLLRLLFQGLEESRGNDLYWSRLSENARLAGEGYLRMRLVFYGSRQWSDIDRSSHINWLKEYGQSPELFIELGLDLIDDFTGYSYNYAEGFKNFEGVFEILNQAIGLEGADQALKRYLFEDQRFHTIRKDARYQSFAQAILGERWWNFDPAAITPKVLRLEIERVNREEFVQGETTSLEVIVLVENLFNFIDEKCTQDQEWLLLSEAQQNRIIADLRYSMILNLAQSQLYLEAIEESRWILNHTDVPYAQELHLMIASYYYNLSESEVYYKYEEAESFTIEEEQRLEWEKSLFDELFLAWKRGKDTPSSLKAFVNDQRFVNLHQDQRWLDILEGKDPAAKEDNIPETEEREADY